MEVAIAGAATLEKDGVALVLSYIIHLKEFLEDLYISMESFQIAFDLDRPIISISL